MLHKIRSQYLGRAALVGALFVAPCTVALASDYVLSVDLDGDGQAETVEVDVGYDAATPRSGHLRAIASGGALLFAIDGDQPNDRFGLVVRAADIDGDGATELLVAVPGAVRDGADRGQVTIYSSEGVRLRSLEAASQTRMGMAVAVCPDQDGDGVTDILVEGAIDVEGEWVARTFLYSARTGHRLADLDATAAGLVQFATEGGMLYLAGDVDDSGQIDATDLLVAASAFVTEPETLRDVNGDGSHDATDILAIAEAIAPEAQSAAAYGVVQEDAAAAADMQSRWSAAYDDAALSVSWGGGDGAEAGQGAGEGGSSPEGGGEMSLLTGGSGDAQLPGVHPCDVPGSGDGQGCDFQITGCGSTSVAIGEVVTLGRPGACFFTIASGGGVLEPVLGDDRQFLAVSVGCAVVEMTCEDGTCTGCQQQCVICVYDPSGPPPCDVAVGFVNCPMGPYPIDLLDRLGFVVAGVPYGGVFHWSVQIMDSEKCPTELQCGTCPDGCEAIYDFTTLTPELNATAALGSATPLPGQWIWVRVRYVAGECITFPENCCDGAPSSCCYAEAVCKVELYDRNCDGDDDDDGYCNCDEIDAGSNPNDDSSIPDLITVDRDADGLSRVDDVRDPPNALLTGFPAYVERFDSDGDGIQDQAELDLGLNPLIRYSTPDVYDRYRPEYLAVDQDFDLVYDLYELRLGLDPTTRDSDGDGIIDGIELRAGTDPLTNHRYESPDSDNDGLSDFEEIEFYGSDPNWYDTDGDGLADDFEVRAGLSAVTAFSSARTVIVYNAFGVPVTIIDQGTLDPDADQDLDGLTNLMEQGYGTDPTRRDSDGDGVDDLTEVEQGSNPRNAGDGGVPPVSDGTCRIRVCLGPSDEMNDKVPERYEITIGDFRFIEPGGANRPLSCVTFTARRGECYPIRMRWLGRRPGSPVHFNYFASIAIEASNIDAPCCSVLLDPDNLLGPHGLAEGEDVSQDRTVGRQATLCLELVDIDVDSDNDSGMGQPDLSLAEDSIEDDPERPGKIVLANTGDTDNDGVPDWADGFDLDGVLGNADDLSSGEAFIPVIVELGGFSDPEAVRVQFLYQDRASDPAAVQVTQPPGAPDPIYSLPSGLIRLWKKDGPEARNKAALPTGDFIAPNTPYALADLGIPEGGKATLYLEAVRKSEAAADIRISIALTAGGACDDAVRVTSLEMTVHDLRHWGPVGATDGVPSEPAVQITDPSNDDALSWPTIGGAITDGASLCLVRTSPQVPGLGLGFAVRRSPTSSFVDRPNTLGAFFPVGESGFSALPAIPMDAEGTGTSSRTSSPTGMALYLPPINYIDSSLYPIPGSLDPGELTKVAFDIELNGISIGTTPFALRRPPIVFVHGLFGSAGDYWGALLANEATGLPVPTRLYFVDYFTTGCSGYDENFRHVPRTIQQALSDYWTATDDTGPHMHWLTPPGLQHHASRSFRGIRYAATRVDVVAHSMGGQITRFYISQVSANVPRPGWPAIIAQRHAPNPPPLSDDYRWYYLRNDNYGVGDIRRFITSASPYNGCCIGTYAAGLFEPTVENIMLVEHIRDQAAYWGFQDPTARAFPTGDRTILPAAFVDLAPNSIAQQLMEGAPVAQFSGIGSSALYPTGRSMVRWYPIAGRIFASGQYGISLLGNELLRYVPFDDDCAANLGPNLSDGVVSIESAMNRMPQTPLPGNPAEEPPLDSHEHSQKPNPIYDAMNSSPTLATVIRRLLSGPDTAMNKDGLDK